jgi:ATP-dependent protease Clp ATPase subunit
MTARRTYCSFCGKSDLEADVLLAGPALAFICDECVELCVETVAQKRTDRKLEREAVLCAGCTPRPLQSVASA